MAARRGNVSEPGIERVKGEDKMEADMDSPPKPVPGRRRCLCFGRVNRHVMFNFGEWVLPDAGVHPRFSQSISTL